MKLSETAAAPKPRDLLMGSTSSSSEEDSSLLKRLRSGDDAAFEHWVRRQGPRMLAVARRFLHSEEDAQDAVQDAFLMAFRALDRFQGNASLSTWLYRIVVNAALMKIRNRKRRPTVSMEELLPGFLEDGHQQEPASEWDLSAEELAGRRETRALVRSAIDRLPATYRTVLLLRDIEELDTGETAQVLGISENAVKIRLHRARQALRALLDPHFRTAAG